MSEANNSSTNSKSYLLGAGFFSQVLLALALLTVIFVLFITFEYLYVLFLKIGTRNVQLLPYTVTAEDKQIIFRQDTTKYPDAKQLPFSDNERSGVEFTYSFYLFVNPSTFKGDDVLHHVFHKGFTSQWPLMGPGVFIKGNANTMRVIMNTYENPYTHIDIENIPVRKWFHCAVICRKNGLEIYINGNLSKKLPFKGTLPYQNFQDLILFSQNNLTVSKTGAACLKDIDGDTLRFSGAFSGNLSNLVYLAYAASFTEIQTLMNFGVSKKTVTQSQDVPPYLTDTYWTSSYQMQN